MQTLNTDDDSPFQSSRPVRFQFSIVHLLIAMTIFAVMSGCLLWASRLSLVTDEFHAWMGTISANNRDGSDRSMQLIFLIFCYSSPLVLAGVLNLIVLAVRGYSRFAKSRARTETKEWEME